MTVEEGRKVGVDQEPQLQSQLHFLEHKAGNYRRAQQLSLTGPVAIEPIIEMDIQYESKKSGGEPVVAVNSSGSLYNTPVEIMIALANHLDKLDTNSLIIPEDLKLR